MPWTVKNVPPAAKHLKGHSRAIFVAAANAALKEYKDDGRAIATGLKAANDYKAKKVKSVKKSVVDGIMDWIDKAFGSPSKEVSHVVEVNKSLDIEQRRALFVVLEPDAVDEHGDTYSAEEVEKACTSFNTHCNQANIFHRIQTEDAKIEQSFISPSTFTLDNGTEIKKGTWLQWWHFPEDNPNSELLWKMVKDNEVQGVSIGCSAKVEDLE